MAVTSSYFPVHAHGEKSWLDGMGTVQQMVAKVAIKLGQPAMALTDHGVMADAIRLYLECKKHGIIPFPGEEFYIVRDVEDEAKRDRRFHVGILALDQRGYEALVWLSSRSHQRDRFHRKPLIDFSDLAYLSAEGHTEHMALTTGCFFGYPIQLLLEKGPDACERMIKMYARWFPHTFVEVQNHGIDHADEGMDDILISNTLVGIADKLGLPVVLGQDSHYCDGGHQAAHNMMKEICYFGDTDDAKFPGGPFHLASVKWLQKQGNNAAMWPRIEEGHAKLLDLNKLVLPELDTYKFYVPEVSANPDVRLKKLCQRGLEAKGFDMWQHYQDRVKHELSIIAQMGMSNYHLLVGELCDWMKRNGIMFNARGSANGSLVCYVMGITNVEPIEWHTEFDRYLSLDRKKPPDIDLDVESSKRHLVVEQMRVRFPTVVPIGTYNRLGINEEVDEFGHGEDRGSVFVQYMAAMRRKQGKLFDNKVAPQHRKPLNDLADLDVRKAPGTHAAGYVLASHDHPISKYLATMLIASSNTTVTQAPMEDVEDAGYMKMDLLGLRTLETVNMCLTLIGKPPGEFDWIPWDDKRACTVLRSGKTDGIFQFEGWATRMGAKQMQVRSTMDAIFCLALFRPALMDTGYTQTFLSNRELGIRPVPHPMLNSILDETFGVPVFQEQVTSIMRAVGLPYEPLNDLMKAVKASGGKIDEYARATIARVEPLFMRSAKIAGMSSAEAHETWGMVTGFTDYGFNRAHATSYGQMSYRAAYLKAHYPTEFMASVLAVWAGSKKEPKYVTEARRLGIVVVRPDINYSDVVWAIDKSRREPSLRKGLTSIDGVGFTVAEAIVAERETNGQYTAMDEFVDRVPARPVSGGKTWKATGTPNGVMLVLQKAGALRSIGIAREM